MIISFTYIDFSSINKQGFLFLLRSTTGQFSELYSELPLHIANYLAAALPFMILGSAAGSPHGPCNAMLEKEHSILCNSSPYLLAHSCIQAGEHQHKQVITALHKSDNNQAGLPQTEFLFFLKLGQDFCTTLVCCRTPLN